MARRRMIVRAEHADRHRRSEPFEVFTRPQRSLPARLLGLAVRMRAEITVAALALTAWVWLTDHLSTAAAAATLGLVLVALGVFGPARRYLLRRVLAVLTRHRLRAAFVERRIMNYTGNLPILLWSRPTAVGEQVWVLLRAGIDLADIEHNLDHIASTCFARGARASALRSVTALVGVEVVRRDPLTAGVVPSAFTPASFTPADLHWLRRVSQGKEC